MPGGKRTFRVFVSSTFEDLVEERNALQRQVFPRLRALCEKHGTSFQAVDLRWGVRDEAILGQKLMDICLAEIARCKQTGLSPNFVILLGSRYGTHPLPTRIAASEFETLAPHLGGFETLVRHWYQRDDNAEPPEYLLKPRAREFVDEHLWNQVGAQLREGLQTAAHAAGFDRQTRLKYEGSATHQEIAEGLGVTTQERRQAYAFLMKPVATEPCELTELKTFLQTELAENAIEWDERDVEKLCDAVYICLERALLQEISRNGVPSPSENEVRTHDDFANSHTRQFVGREAILDHIFRYLASDDRRPLVVYGTSGSGKSALMAVASDRAPRMYPGSAVIRRFIGASPRSMNGLTLLQELCEQLGKLTHTSSELPTTMEKAIDAFSGLLSVGTEKRTIILFIDALDQLPDGDPASALSWLPVYLPPNCRLVVSTSQVPEMLRSAQLREVEPFSEEEAQQALSLWLRGVNRKLGGEQHAKVIEAFLRCPLPFYLSLAFEEAQHWRSFDPIENCVLAEGLQAIIHQLVERLEADHGPILVQHSLRYLTAARRGLSEDEILDRLAADDEVWGDVVSQSHYVLPSRQLPFVIWSRFYLDLEPYLAESFDEAGNLLGFYHRQLPEHVASKLLQGDAGVHTHSQLAAHFRAKGDPQSDESWTGPSPRSRAELPYHLAKVENAIARQEKETLVERLLTSLPYLCARVRDGDVYGLMADYALAPNSARAHAWRDFLRRHTQRLTEHRDMLVALVQLEGFPSAREQVDSRIWRTRWLRCVPEPKPFVQTSESGLVLELEGAKEYGTGKVSGVARQANVLFRLERLGVVRMTDCRDMQEWPTNLEIGRDRPVRLACAPDGSNLLVLFESGSAELHRCTKGSNEQIASSRVIARFDYLLPEISDPVVEWHNGVYYLQVRMETLARLDGLTGTITEDALAPEMSGELAALLFLPGGRRFVATRQRGSVCLTSGSGAPLKRERVDFCSACIYGDRAAVAFSDGYITIYKIEDTPAPVLTVKSGILLGELGCDGQRLIWVKECPGFHKLHVWGIGEKESQEVQEGQRVFPAGLHVIPKSWAADGPDTILVQTTHSLARFRFRSGNSVRRGRVMQLFGGPVWRAVRMEEQTQWLWQGDPNGEIQLGTDIPGRIYCAIDGRNLFYSARVDRVGKIWNLTTGEASLLKYTPMPFNFAAGDPEKGCWFVDRTGSIYYAEDDHELSFKDKVEEGTGSIIHICGDYIVWRGFVPQWSPKSGHEQARTFVFFKRKVNGKAQLERAGERHFAVREGLCIAMDYDSVSRRIMMLWQREHDTPVLRIAAVEDFLKSRFQDFEVPAAGPLRAAQMAISPDGLIVGIINVSGDFVCVGANDGKEVATLAGSLPFTHVAAGGSGNSFWLVEAMDSIYSCTLTRSV